MAFKPTQQEPAPEPEKKGRAHLLQQSWQWIRNSRPDRSRHGFDQAIDEALDLVSQYAYFEADYVVDEILDYVAHALRSGAVHARHIGNNRTTGSARVKIWTDWGLRAVLDLDLVFATKRTPTGGRTN